MSDELRVGIEREELVLQYQPIVDRPRATPPASRRCVRWQHPEHGRIPPLEFIPSPRRAG